MIALFILAAQAQATAQTPPADPKRVLMIEDAIFSIPDVVGRVARVADFDGDKVDDLVVERGGSTEGRQRFDLMSSKTGTLIRPWWPKTPDRERATSWDVGGDVDGDGVQDLLLGYQHFYGHGLVLVVSGKTNEIIRAVEGTSPIESVGASVAFLGDIDGDGAADFVYGAPETDIYLWTPASPEQPTEEEQHGLETSNPALTERFLGERTTRTGYVSIRSGKTATELRRVRGTKPGHAFGYAVSNAHDVDGDHSPDLVVMCDQRSNEPVRIVSSLTGKVLTETPACHGSIQGFCDVNADGATDILLDFQLMNSEVRSRQPTCVSGKSGENLFEFPMCYASTAGGVFLTGDLDSDAIPDVAVAEPRYGLLPPENNPDPATRGKPLRTLALDQAVTLEPAYSMLGVFGGRVIIYSGRTQKPIMGVWAPVGSDLSLGEHVCGLPDLNGDGSPEVLVTAPGIAYVFASPAQGAGGK